MRVPAQQKEIFKAGEKFDGDVVLAFKSIAHDPSIVNYVVDVLNEAIRFQGGSKHTFVEGKIVPFISELLSAKLKSSDGFRVFRMTTCDAEGSIQIGQTGAIDVQTTGDVRADIAKIGAQAWAERYLLQNRSPNRALFERITKNKAYWLGPIDVPVADLVPMAGPGRKYHEDQAVWDMRAEQIVKAANSPNDLPPSIAFLRVESDGSRQLVLADGAHRHEAFKRLGFKTMPVLLWFDSKALYEEFQAGIAA
ncbi:hypothetical protein D9M72_506240 [compost metagenome]